MSPSLWPLHDLRVRTPLLELRYPREAEIEVIARLSTDVHDPGLMPFRTPWSDAPSPELERNTMQFLWRCAAEVRPDDWHLPMAVVLLEGKAAGDPVGVQGLVGADFPHRRTVETGSWVARPMQGRGLGAEMRAAALHLVFEGLGADRAHTGAYDDNAASLAVTAKFPYEPNGDDVIAPRGEPKRELRFVMHREAWQAIRRDDITIGGLEHCRELLGV